MVAVKQTFVYKFGLFVFHQEVGFYVQGSLHRTTASGSQHHPTARHSPTRLSMTLMSNGGQFIFFLHENSSTFLLFKMFWNHCKDFILMYK